MQGSSRKVALITGANKGIGFEAARQLAKQGFIVLLTARNIRPSEQGAAKLTSQGLDVRFLELDLI